MSDSWFKVKTFYLDADEVEGVAEHDTLTNACTIYMKSGRSIGLRQISASEVLEQVTAHVTGANESFPRATLEYLQTEEKMVDETSTPDPVTLAEARKPVAMPTEDATLAEAVELEQEVEEDTIADAAKEAVKQVSPKRGRVTGAEVKA